MVRSAGKPSEGRALLLLLLLALGAGGCKGDKNAAADEPRREPRVLARISFEETVHIEAGMATWKVLQRIRAAKESIFPALDRAEILLSVRKRAEVEVTSIQKEPVTAVDRATGARRDALRVRYRFIGGALVPKSVAERGELRLAMLHTLDRSNAEAVLTQCTANGDRERALSPDLTPVFDPTLPTCESAVAAEGKAIAAARARLEHPDKEIVPAELKRTYIPIVLHIEPRAPEGHDPRAADPPAPPPSLAAPADPSTQLAAVAAAPTPGVEAPAPAPTAPSAPHRVSLLADGPAVPAAPSPAPDQPVAPAKVAPAAPGPAGPVEESGETLAAALLTRRDLAQDLAADDAELAQKDRAAAVAAGLAAPPLPGEESPIVDFVMPERGATNWANANVGMLLQPNFLMMYVAVIAMGILLVGKRRKSRR